ncbi:MAG: hypothetical protein LBO69_09135 [Ignavibacteria bacterium]|jgi:hypothetical protein|nr:hypothetical protein [Ignavibacteria bacterium]
MAKEEPEENLDDAADNAAESKKKPKKEKKTKEPNEDGKPSTILIAGGAAGLMILIIISVIVGSVIAQKMFPIEASAVVATEETEHAEGDEHSAKKLPPMPDGEEGGEDVISMLADDSWLSFSSDKIQTNPSDNARAVCILNVAVTYKPYYVDQLTARGFLIPAPAAGGGGHGEAPAHEEGAKVPMIADTNNSIYKSLRQSVASTLGGFLGSHTQASLQAMQSSNTLTDTLKSVLKTPFRNTGLIVGKVEITNFMIAPM